MKTIFLRHFLVTALMVLLSVIMLGVTFVSLSYGYISREQQAQLSQNAETAALLVEATVSQGMQDLPFRFRMTLTTMSTMAGGHILVCDDTGKVYMCSDAPGCPHVGMKVPETVVEQVRHDGDYRGQPDMGELYGAAYNVAGRVVRLADGRICGFVFVSSKAAGERGLILTFIRIFLSTSLGVLLIASLSAWLLSSRMTRPLKRMAEAAGQFAQGDFTARVPAGPIPRHDELGELVTNFNHMADSLQKLEELRSGFIGDVSHELRTPMTTISGFIDGMLDGTLPTETHEKYLVIVRDEVMRLSRLVARMLDLARLQSGETSFKPQNLDVTEAMRRVIISLESRISDKELEVELDVPKEAVMVYFDADALTQILFNLTENAAKYAHPQTVLRFSLARRGTKIAISVANTGDTIPADELPYLFDRFHKADKSRSSEGMGLGLYIVRAILHSRGEEITVTSQGGVTTFTFTLRQNSHDI